MCYKYFTMKTKLLSYLEARKGEYVSGEALAEKFGVSRAAVWKAVASLRNDGHVITAITNKGYSLVRTSDVLSDEGIRSSLKNGSLMTLTRQTTTPRSSLLPAQNTGLLLLRTGRLQEEAGTATRSSPLPEQGYTCR